MNERSVRDLAKLEVLQNKKGWTLRRISDHLKLSYRTVVDRNRQLSRFLQLIYTFENEVDRLEDEDGE